LGVTGSRQIAANRRARGLAPIGERNRNRVNGARWASRHGWSHRGNHWWHNGNRTNIVYVAGVYPWAAWGFPDYYAYNDYDWPSNYDYDDTGYYDTGYYGGVSAAVSPAPVGESVAVQVQNVLSQNGYYSGAIDGLIGPASRRAIRAYQADHGLSVTGRIDSELLQSLGV